MGSTTDTDIHLVTTTRLNRVSALPELLLTLTESALAALLRHATDGPVVERLSRWVWKKLLVAGCVLGA